LQEKYDLINKSATSADVKKEAYEILERNYRIYNQNMTDNYNTRAGAMLSQWNVDPTLTLNDFQKTDDYKSLTPRQQNTFAGKLKYEMYQRDQQERSINASERAVRNDQYTQEQREKAEQAEVFKKSSDALYNKLSDDDNALALMPDATFQAQESLMDSTLYRTLSKQRKKAQEDLPTSKLVSNYLNAFCKKNNISAEDKQLYRTAITNNLGDEKELSVINKRIPEILQNTVLEKHWYKTNEVKVNTPKLAPDGSLDKTEKYEVDKIYTDAQGRKAKYIGNGQWQIQ
jgi:membrane-associated HD superfamily phosphohydrolase